MAELLAHYADSVLRGTTKFGAEDELDKRLDEVVQLFGYVNEKDLFNETYRCAINMTPSFNETCLLLTVSFPLHTFLFHFRAQLSRRLLSRKIMDHEEKEMIVKLKRKVG